MIVVWDRKTQLNAKGNNFLCFHGEYSKWC